MTKKELARNMNNVEEFTNAIILRAVQDYKFATKKLKIDPTNEKYLGTQQEVSKFLLSDGFSFLTQLDGKTLLCSLNYSLQQTM